MKLIEKNKENTGSNNLMYNTTINTNVHSTRRKK